MNLTSSRIIKELLSKHGSKPNKIMGQNFLIDKNILEKIIKAANLSKNDTVLEIGPGIGTLTQELAKNAGEVIAVEKDKIMIKILAETLANYENVEVINADILRYKLFTTNYKLIANIPYYLTSPLIRKFLEAENPPKEMVSMVQKEIAQRICSKPPKMSLLAVSVQFYAEPKTISHVSKNCFWPAPKVDSAIIEIHPVKSPEGRILAKPKLFNWVNSAQENQAFRMLFFKIAKAGFSHPRKQLLGNLSGGLKLSKETTAQWLKRNNIPPIQRAETLSIADWQNLAKSFPQLPNLNT